MDTGYFAAAALGALSVVAVQLILRRRRLAASRRGPSAQQSFRRYEVLIVPDERGTTEVDEIFVTPAGIFVVERKDFGAWIYAHESDETWTAVYPNREKHRFQNPIRQNYRHIKALQSFLRQPRSVFHSMIVFSPRARFMTAIPPHVFTAGHVDYIVDQNEVALSPEDFDSVCADLDALRATSDASSLHVHVEKLHARFDSTEQCPRCGGYLTRRYSRKPGNEHNVFLGCSNFPRCRFIRNLATS